MCKNILLLIFCCSSLFAGSIEYPETKEIPVSNFYHGEKIIDEYQWLEDGDDPEVQEWQSEQNQFALKEFDKINPKWRLLLFKGNDDKCSILNREHRYLNTLPTFSLCEDGCSLDGKYCVYCSATTAGESHELHIVDKIDDTCIGMIPSGEKRSKCSKDSIVWSNDNLGFYYINQDEKENFKYYLVQSKNIYNIRLPGDHYVPATADYGLSSGGDKAVFGKTKNGLRSDLYFHPRDSKILSKRFSIDSMRSIAKELLMGSYSCYQKNCFLTSFDDSPKGSVYISKVGGDKAGIDIREIVPACEDVITEIYACDKFCVVVYLHDAAYTKIKVYDFDGNLLHNINFPEIGHLHNLIFLDKDKLRIGMDFFIEKSVYEFDLVDGVLKHVKFVDEAWKNNGMIVSQVKCKSKDGTIVPIIVVYHKDIVLDGKNPLLLYGYGDAGGIQPDESFLDSNGVSSWLYSGGVIAIANVRGGGEYGKLWETSGYLENRQNSIDDFIAATLWLIDNKWTNSEKLVSYGDSAGGFLVAAAAMQRPELFRAVKSGIPWLDLIRLGQLTSDWMHASVYSRFGNSDDPDLFPYLKLLSPYHNILEKRYPAMFFIAGKEDPRCYPGHVRKMVAKLQKHNISDNPIYMYIEDGGHGISAWLDMMGIMFLMDQVGMSTHLALFERTFMKFCTSIASCLGEIDSSIGKNSLLTAFFSDKEFIPRKEFEGMILSLVVALLDGEELLHVFSGESDFSKTVKEMIREIRSRINEELLLDDLKDEIIKEIFEQKDSQLRILTEKLISTIYDKIIDN